MTSERSHITMGAWYVAHLAMGLATVRIYRPDLYRAWFAR